jgi:hypothetical protein
MARAETKDAARRAKLIERRASAAADAPEIEQVLRGTLRRRYVRCGKPGCHCRDGVGHGPIVYLSVTFAGGSTKQITIAPEDYEYAKRLVGNYQKLYAALERVSTINREILQERLTSSSGDEPLRQRRHRRRKKRG